MECKSIDGGTSERSMTWASPDLRGRQVEPLPRNRRFPGQESTSSLRPILCGGKLQLLAPM
eukprot:16101400-Heterocapsa_arctica.AAC.1